LLRKLYKKGIWVIAAKRKGVYVPLSIFKENWRHSEMFITPAFAQSGGFAEGGFGLLPIVFVMVIFYFLLIRPQQKRAKQHRELLAAIRRGDKIVTTGGLTGTVVKVTDDVDTVDVEIATGVKVQIVRAMIADVRGKNEPVKAEPVKAKSAK
jgi:preprotein translocase subunit YajC